MKAVPGIKLTEAEIDDGNYEMDGLVGDQKYEVKISLKGKIVKIKKDNDEKDENGDDNDNDNEVEDAD